MIQLKNPKFKIAFYHVLRDTIVCNSLDIASDIAFNRKQRMRVVTVDGKLIEPSGIMSGGGKPKKGGMGNKISKDPEDLSQLNNKKQEIQARIKMLQQ